MMVFCEKGDDKQKASKDDKDLVPRTGAPSDLLTRASGISREMVSLLEGSGKCMKKRMVRLLETIFFSLEYG